LTSIFTDSMSFGSDQAFSLESSDSFTQTDFGTPNNWGANDQFEVSPMPNPFSDAGSLATPDTAAESGTLLAQATDGLTPQQARAGLEHVNFSYGGETHSFMSLQSVGRYPQTYDTQQKDYDAKNPTQYQWGVKDELHEAGCTITALGNALGATGEPSPNPMQTNARTPQFWKAFNAAEFDDLSGQGKRIYRRPINIPPKIEVMDPVNIHNDDRTGYTTETKAILEATAQSVRDGKAVLFGVRGNGDYRHSFVVDAVGDKLWASDPWTWGQHAERKPLEQAIEDAGGTQIDYAYSVSRKNRIPVGY